MATFDDTQQAKLIKILRIDAITLSGHLIYVAEQITDEMKTEVVAAIAEWGTGTISRNTTRIKAMEANFGAEINPNDVRKIIQNEIADYLFCNDLINHGNGNGQVRLMRG